MDQHEANEARTQISKQIKWVIPDSIRTDHATHLVLQQQGLEVVLLFFELQGPVLMGTPEEQLAAYNQLPSVEARCVAKLVMSVENVALVANKFIQAVTLAQKGAENVNTGS